MIQSAVAYKEIQRELKGLPSEQLVEVLNFVQFIKAKDAIDPSQSYFWTRPWQQMEKEAEEDMRVGRVHPYDSIEAFEEGLPIRKSLRDRLVLQKKAVSEGERGESFEDMAHRRSYNR